MESAHESMGGMSNAGGYGPGDDRSRPTIVDDGGAPVVPSAARPPSAKALAAELQRQRREFDRLRQITERVNRGVRLDEILDFIFDEFRDIIPYHRIAYAAIDYQAERIVARWARSDGPPAFPVGYGHRFEGTSLMDLAATGRPRIINDLAAYLERHPASEVTRMLLAEGHRSSLTCPLVVEDRPVGFMFFDCQRPAVYGDVHVEFFVQIAGVISVAVERGRVVSQLAEHKALVDRQNRELSEENRRNQHELEMARKVQRALIPETLPACPGLEMAVLYEPALPVGGDLLDVIPLSDDRLLVYVADAMGHGVPAALLMSVVHTAFHGAISATRAGHCPSPAAVLREVNRTVIDLFETNYVTAVCARIDLPRRRMTLSLAGHPPAMLVRRTQGTVERLSAGNIPMGIDRDTPYEEAPASFEPDDMLLLYTDGIIEAAAPDHTQYGLAQLERLLLASRDLSAAQVTERLRADVVRHLGGRAPGDDIAALALGLACHR